MHMFSPRSQDGHFTFRHKVILKWGRAESKRRVATDSPRSPVQQACTCTPLACAAKESEDAWIHRSIEQNRGSVSKVKVEGGCGCLGHQQALLPMAYLVTSSTKHEHLIPAWHWGIVLMENWERCPGSSSPRFKNEYILLQYYLSFKTLEITKCLKPKIRRISQQPLVGIE